MTKQGGRRAAAHEVVIDARWLGVGGTSRVLQCLLDGVVVMGRASTVGLWVRERTDDRFADVTRAQRSGMSPLSLFFESTLPRARHYVFPHVLRPLWVRQCSVIIYDTIPLRYGSRIRRPIWWVIFRLSARRASRVFTFSEFSRQRIADDTGMSLDRIQVLQMPVNTDFIDQIRTARSAAQSRDDAPYILYFGQFKSHKNLERLIAGFCASNFASKGGRLIMVGGKDKAVQHLRLQIPGTMASQVTIDGQQDSAKLVELVAGARAVAFVSLEEGFGLPPLEASLAGVPTLSVNLPWAHEAIPVDVPRCDPTSTESIAVGIDKVVDQSAAHTCDLQQALDQHRQGVTAQAMAEAIMSSIVL